MTAESRGAVLHVQRAAGEAQAPGDRDLQRWVDAVLQGVTPRYELTIRIVDEEESRKLNHSYRDLDYATNVLSFGSGLEEKIQSELESRTGCRLLGDLVICAAVVAREASEQGKLLDQHWAHLVVHGILHLLGHDHEDADAAIEMEWAEIQILSALGIPNPYLLR